MPDFGKALSSITLTVEEITTSLRFAVLLNARLSICSRPSFKTTFSTVDESNARPSDSTLDASSTVLTLEL